MRCLLESGATLLYNSVGAAQGSEVHFTLPLPMPCKEIPIQGVKVLPLPYEALLNVMLTVHVPISRPVNPITGPFTSPGPVNPDGHQN